MFSFLLIPTVCFNYIYFWMRNQLNMIELEDKKFRFERFDLKVYPEFIYRIKTDLELKKKFYRLLYICLYFNILGAILIWILFHENS
jgi:hypothetical protein